MLPQTHTQSHAQYNICAWSLYRRRRRRRHHTHCKYSKRYNMAYFSWATGVCEAIFHVPSQFTFVGWIVKKSVEWSWLQTKETVLCSQIKLRCVTIENGNSMRWFGDFVLEIENILKFRIENIEIISTILIKRGYQTIVLHSMVQSNTGNFNWSKFYWSSIVAHHQNEQKIEKK